MDAFCAKENILTNGILNVSKDGLDLENKGDRNEPLGE